MIPSLVRWVKRSSVAIAMTYIAAMAQIQSLAWRISKCYGYGHKKIKIKYLFFISEGSRDKMVLGVYTFVYMKKKNLQI